MGIAHIVTREIPCEMASDALDSSWKLGYETYNHFLTKCVIVNALQRELYPLPVNEIAAEWKAYFLYASQLID